MAIAGRVAIVPKGDWSADATYKRLDAVTYNNTLYFAKKDVPAGTATSNTEYWSKSIVGSVVTVDDALSSTSINPVQNKVVTSNLTDLRKGAVTNLLNPTLRTTTQNGVTCTNNGDGTYTFNGTATGIATFIVQMIESISEKHLNENLWLVGCPKNSSTVAYSLQLWIKDHGTISDIGDGVKVHIEKGALGNIGIVFNKGTQVNNLVFKPMLTTNLNATYDDFVPYTGDTGRLNGDVAELKAQSVKKDNVVNNQTTTEAGYALDARQANPNLDGTLAKQISDLNGSLNYKSVKAVIGSEKIDVSQYIGKEFLIQVNVDNNAFLGISVAGIFGTILYYNQGGKMPYDISCLLEYSNGTICLKSAYFGDLDKTSTTFMNVYVR